jgi:hypothetical protein
VLYNNRNKMPDYIVVDNYNMNELVELEMWIQEARNNSNRKINPHTARVDDDDDELESEEDEKMRRELQATGERPCRGGLFTIYSGLPTRK